ncbi:hypothetical protein C2E23DRAFT_881340 [Lenzites betulinus]|nr:hypothetical protein C2E23DRAFT_881340 [Lenzites betulinus]
MSSKHGFNLDISGVAGFFGGDVSVSAMATVHIYRGRKWLGWYNQPGSYEIAKRYGQLSRARFWDALYPGVNVDPAALFGLDGTVGPKFIGPKSDTVLSGTTHVAHLFAKECESTRPRMLPPGIPMRLRNSGFVTIANLTYTPPFDTVPTQKRDLTTTLACLPIFTSIGACVGCAAIRDWYCFAIILLGIISSGLSCLVIGMGTLKFSHPTPANGVPPGDGILDCKSTDSLVILKGPEGAVNSITRGHFSLDYSSKPEYHTIGVCSLLLTLQFVVQLILVPQATLHGQLFFLASLICAWAYNSYLSSFDRESIQRNILCEEVLRVAPEQLEKYHLGTRTAMVTFALLLVAPAETHALRRVLDDLIPNNTAVWRHWKSEVLRCVEEAFDQDAVTFTFDFKPPAEAFPPEAQWLLNTLFRDADTAAAMYGLYQQGRNAPDIPSKDNTPSYIGDAALQYA